MELGAIVGRLVLDDQFTGALNNATDNAKKSMGDVQKHVAVATGAVLAMGAATFALAQRTAKLQDEMGKAAKAAGLSVEAYSKLAYAAKMSDVNTETLGRAMRSLLQPSQQAVAAMSKLGVSTVTATGKAREAEDILRDLADSFKNLKNPGDAAALAVQIFGERGSDMLNMLADGSAGLDELGDAAARFGIVVSRQAAAEADRFGDAVDNLGFAVDGLSQSIGQSIVQFVNQSGIMEDLAEQIAEITRTWNELDDSTKKAILTAGAVAVAIAAVVAAFVALGAIIPIVVASLTAILKQMTLTFGPVGIGIMVAVAAITALAAASYALRDNVEASIRAVNQEAEAMQDASKTYEQLAGKKKLTAQETRKLAEADAALEKAARAAGIAIDGEVMSLEEKRKKLEEVRSAQRLQLAQQLVSLGERREAMESQIRGLRNEAEGYLSGGTTIDAAMRMNAQQLSQLPGRVAGNIRLIRDFQQSIAQINRLTTEAFAAMGSTIERPASEAGQNAGRSFSAGVASVVQMEFKKSRDWFEAIEEEFFSWSGSASQRIGQKMTGMFSSAILKRRLEDAQFTRVNTVTDSTGASMPFEEPIPEAEARKFKERFQKAFEEGGMDGLRESIDKASKDEGLKGGEQLAAGMEKGLDAGASSIEKALMQILESAYKLFQDVLNNKIENIKRKTEILDWSSKMITQWMQKQHAIEIQALEDVENEKIRIMQQAQIEKLALIDEEFAARKQQLEDELKLRIATERLAFEQRKKTLEDRSADDEQRRLASKVMEDDWSQYVKKLEEETQEKIAEAATDGQQKKAQATLESNTQIEAAETNKTLMLEQKRKDQELIEKNHAKQVMAIRYTLDLAAFELNKRLQLAQITMQLGQNIMSASQAAAQMVAFLGPAGLFLAPVVFGLLSSMAYASYSMARASIASAVLLPPAELFAAEGGTIMGPSHAMGGVPVRAEGGETILSRDLTDKLDRSLDQKGGGVVVTIQPGAIAIYGVSGVNDRVVEQIADAVGRKIEQRRF